MVLAPPERAVLHQRIEARFDAMLAAGFLDEVRTLRVLPALAAHPHPLDLPALRAVGYRQAWEFLDEKASSQQFRERAIAATRQLAKRQYTWLRGEPVSYTHLDVYKRQVTAFDAFVVGSVEDAGPTDRLNGCGILGTGDFGARSHLSLIHI